MNSTRYSSIIFFSAVIFLISSCKKFIDPGAPETGLIKETVFQSDATANGAMLGVYYNVLNSGFAQDYSGISAITGLYTDELRSYTTLANSREVYSNSLVSMSSYTRTIWQNLYTTLYQVNSVIEGVGASETLSPEVTDRLLSEAHFLRAFLYFYLTNLYGEVPLILSSDYEITRLQARVSVEEIYTQILNDLNSAEEMAGDQYIAGDGSAGSERIRANKSVIEAFKARVMLYRKDFAAAESYASRVIDKGDIYQLEEDLTQSFLGTSREAILQLKPANEGYTADGYNFIFTGKPTTGVQKSSALTPYIVSLFEPQDQRKAAWVGENNVDGTSYYFAYKYKSSFETPGTPEYLMTLRLSEMYLIRAEARAEQANLTGLNSAVSDLQVIRDRAGLTDPITLSSYDEIMELIEAERQRELFTEWGHRFLDLKRWKGRVDPSASRIDEVMPAVATGKGGNWMPYEKLFPIPQNERTKAPNLSQNEGYN